LISSTKFIFYIVEKKKKKKKNPTTKTGHDRKLDEFIMARIGLVFHLKTSYRALKYSIIDCHQLEWIHGNIFNKVHVKYSSNQRRRLA